MQHFFNSLILLATTFQYPYGHIPFHSFSIPASSHTLSYISIKLLTHMAPPGRTYPLLGFTVAITLVLFFSLTVLLPKSGGSVFPDSNKSLEESKVVIGSKPPACRNKCMKCRPCIATVVVPNHKKIKGFKVSSHREDDSYYLLSWKCRCGDKFFQP